MKINKSELVREAIQNEMNELPENLEKRKNELLMEIEEINKKLENLSKRIAEKNDYLDVIANEFQQFHRENHGDEQNIRWLEDRYREKLDSKNIHMSTEDILKYCIEKSKIKKEVGK